jgi:adhesin transport system outer membrane protein
MSIATARSSFLRVTALSLALSPLVASAYCEGPATPPDSKETLLDMVPFSAAKSTEPSIGATGRTQLSELVRTAVAASADNRGAEHGRAAAAFDLAQTRAGTSPQVSLNSTLGIGGGHQGDASFGTTGVNTVGLAVSAPLYDGGRIDALTRYREQLLGVSSSTVGSTRERVAREAVLTVLERNRFSLQLKVYQQYVAKLSCLSRSIEQIVEADPGRASERVQARKSLRQAEIARDEAQSSLRQAEARLARIVGEQPSLWTAAGVPLIEVPALDTVLAHSRYNPEVYQLRLQADALTHYARATTAEQSPQVRWQAGVNSARQYTQVTSQSWNVGLALNYTLADGGLNRAASGAAQERAEAARQAWENALNERAKQAAAQHDAARNAFQRAQHYGELLQDSDALRNATYVQWIKLGRRSLFDLISAESEHHQLRLSYVNALHDGYTASTQLRNAGSGLLPWLAPDLATTTPP